MHKNDGQYPAQKGQKCDLGEKSADKGRGMKVELGADGSNSGKIFYAVKRGAYACLLQGIQSRHGGRSGLRGRQAKISQAVSGQPAFFCAEPVLTGGCGA